MSGSMRDGSETLLDDEPLPARAERGRSRAEAGETAALLDYAAASACRGEHEEAARAIRRARRSGIAEERIEPVAVLAAWRAGDAARARASLPRQPSAALRAMVSLAELEQEDEATPPPEGGDPLATYARARFAMAEGETARALEGLDAIHVAGLLGCLVERARGEARLRLGDVAGARDALSIAVWQILSLDSPDELGRAYLAMAEVESRDIDAEGRPRDRAAEWLARAHELLQRHGTALDQAKLRRLFRRFGRRAIDRLVEGDLESRIEGVRTARARLRDRRGAADEARQRGINVAELEAELSATLDELTEAEEALVNALEGVLVDRDRMGRLVQAARRLYALESAPEIDVAFPRLALELDGGGCAALVMLRRDQPVGRADDARPLHVVSTAGGDPTLVLEAIAPELDDTFRSGQARLLGEEDLRSAVIPLPTTLRELVLVVQRPTKRNPLGGEEVERLSVLASVAVAVYDRARGAEALREAAERDAAILETIRDGILALDETRRVRSINRAAAALLGSSRDDLLGRVLDERSGLGALADAAEREVDDEPVTLPRVELLVRARRHPGGSVLMLRELASAQQLAQRLVGGAARFSFEDLVGDDPAFRRVLADARRAAASDVPILITGESGTGKELLAQAIHHGSPRGREPFVGLNVAAIPRELLESELFGYEAGAFTGARARGHAGKFELAGRGTLLLDEIGDMPFDMQAKMLRVLQERVVQRLGGTRELPIRARIVATTHRDLEKSVDEGSFRLDLYYRLRVVHLKLPPLRERRGDIPRLIERHLAIYAERTRRPPVRFSDAVTRDLVRYDWPGNIRELANLVEGAASLVAPDVDVIEELPAFVKLRNVQHSSVPPPMPPAASLGEVRSLEAIEREAFAHALAVFDGNVAAAAKALGVARGTFYAKIQRYGLRD
ncbi:MAG: sigma 54-interacting transcriptional regulator [Sandaracinus sp.]|nr:sigma 54-interacting transcriptional regulator [Myxococcales bacterium]MCB9611053.1 sigma 54-interacting transcriptional regulator [Sandaracinus sp.]